MNKRKEEILRKSLERKFIPRNSPTLPVRHESAPRKQEPTYIPIRSDLFGDRVDETTLSPIELEIRQAFLKEKETLGEVGCSSCALNQLKRKYANLLRSRYTERNM